MRSASSCPISSGSKFIPDNCAHMLSTSSNSTRNKVNVKKSCTLQPTLDCKSISSPNNARTPSTSSSSTRNNVNVQESCMLKPTLDSKSIGSPNKARMPIHIDTLADELSTHPDRHFVQSLIRDLRFGCRISFTGNRSISLFSPNLSSAIEFPDVVDEHLATECARGHTSGPFPAPPFKHMRTSGIGVVPKKSGGHRLILHLSALAGDSVNSHIDKDEFKFRLITVDTIADHVRRTGEGALLFKVDLKHAFRLCPVHPDDQPLLGMFWKGAYYYDTVLPFDLRSAPCLFNRLAEALQWVLLNRHGISCLEHYLDDFLSVSPSASDVQTSAAASQMATVLEVFTKLGVPISEGNDKLVGPTTCLTVLGIELDSIAGELRLPQDKLIALRELLDDWSSEKRISKRELQSLVGHLSFAAKVVAAPSQDV